VSPAAPALPLRARRDGTLVYALFGGLLVVSMVASARKGPIEISTSQVLAAVLEPLGLAGRDPVDPQVRAVLFTIRLPRVVLGALIGATLGVSGAATQGLFRNPLAEPSLLGVSGGAVLGAVTGIVFGAHVFGERMHVLGPWFLPVCSFATGLAAAVLAMRVANLEGRTQPAVLLLAGVAVNALAGAGIGLCMHLGNEAQLRSITFWMLGSLGGATWRSVAAVAPFMVVAILWLPRAARALDAMLLGELEAGHLGFSVESTKRRAVALSVLGVGAAVSIAGMIGFVGLVVPHAVRLLVGPQHRRLLPLSALLGASSLTIADLGARTLVAPAELPIGVLTAALGAPLFLVQLLRARRSLA
jgi:iron complex transport system permease protein